MDSAEERKKEIAALIEDAKEPSNGDCSPVSYTHLDVYKRQLIGSGARLSAPGGVITWQFEPKSEDGRFRTCLLYTSIRRRGCWRGNGCTLNARG